MQNVSRDQTIARTGIFTLTNADILFYLCFLILMYLLTGGTFMFSLYQIKLYISFYHLCTALMYYNVKFSILLTTFVNIWICIGNSTIKILRVFELLSHYTVSKEIGSIVRVSIDSTISWMQVLVIRIYTPIQTPIYLLVLTYQDICHIM